MAANANIGAAKGAVLSQLFADPSLGSITHDLSNIIDKRAAIWSVSGGLLQPIFQGWRIFWNYEGHQSSL